VLSKLYRLNTSGDFDRVMKSGRKVVCPSFVIYGLHEESSSVDRLGLVVSKKVGKAVLRNRVKRVLRESFRTGIIPLAVSTKGVADIIVIVRPRAAKLHSQAMREDFLKCLARLKKEMTPVEGERS